MQVVPSLWRRREQDAVDSKGRSRGRQKLGEQSANGMMALVVQAEAARRMTGAILLREMSAPLAVRNQATKHRDGVAAHDD
jgi:hypothetical protein